MTASKPLHETSNRAPELYGLVLAGGRSRRMGQDKGLMDWHGKPQRYYAADLLAQFCAKVFLSCRPDQVTSMAPGYDLLVDTAADAGQFGAIRLALEQHRRVAWLVVACDLPLIDAASLARLVAERDATKLATAFTGSNDLPEPLAAIWEPAARQRLTELHAEGVDCPRKSLIRSAGRVKLLPPPQAYVTMNVNTPAEVATARRLIANQLQEARR